MGLTVQRAETPEEKARIYRFRYHIYVEDMGLQTAEADHERRWVIDALDEVATSYAVVEDGEVMGALRLTRLSAVADRSYLVWKFALESAIATFGPEVICATSRFMLHPRLRNGMAIFKLMKSAYDDGRRAGIRLNYGDCSPHLVPFYEHLGFRRYKAAYNDTVYGFKVPILMLVGDRQRFERVRSPLGRVAAQYPDDTEVRAWFEEQYPDYLGLETASLLPEGAFLDLLAARIASDPLHSVGLLHGLDRGEAERFLSRATLVKAVPGDYVVRQGESGDTLFLLLSGIAEVVRDEAPSAAVTLLGAGDPFGEMGFLTSGRRTANVVARTACEAVVLSGDFLRSFLAKEPAIAAKVLLNLSRVLAERVSDMTARFAAPDPVSPA